MMAKTARHDAQRLLDGAGPTMTLVEAGHVLGISRTTSYALVQRGEWPTKLLRLGRSVRVPTAALRELVEERGMPA